VALVEASLGEQLGDVDFDQSEPHIAAQIANAKGRSSLEYARAAKDIELLSRKLMEPWGRDFDVLVTPTLGIAPPPAGLLMEVSHNAPDEPAEVVVATVAFTALANVTGQPAISLPLGWTSDGLPLGVQLVAAYGREDVLLRVAAQLEEVVPWLNRCPPISFGG
jgi:amidase